MLHNRLRELREFHGWTQSKIAETLGVSRVAYGLHESGKRQMSYESLCTLADLYEVTLDYLLGREAPDMILLDDREKAMISKFRELDKRGQQTIQGIIDIEHARKETGTKAT